MTADGHKDTLGDILKPQEQAEAGRKADPYLPLMARIDGRSFSKFTKGLTKPFDPRFVELMVATTKHLVQESEALLGYCQSDEISLYWHLDRNQFPDREFWFNGKSQKLTSVLSSTATSFFVGNLPGYLPEKQGKYPAFDCRVWSVPDLEHVHKNFLWRYRDAQRNSVSMYARGFFSHRKLQGKTVKDMKAMLSEAGSPWENLPRPFTHGTFLRRQTITVDLNDLDIPEKYRPDGPVLRTVVREWDPQSSSLML